MSVQHAYDHNAEAVKTAHDAESDYQARHVREVPVDQESRAPLVGGDHARRRGFGVLSRLARAEVASA